MSDSDDFDKEAEREKLREQFDRADEGREVTERMSDLLLKGATMTNRHCPECGSPIFRHEDQEFCPTCQRPVKDPETGATGGDSQARPDQQAQPDQQARAGSEPSARTATSREHDDERSSNHVRDPGEGGEAGLRSTDSASPERAARTDAGASGRPDQTGDLSTAETALARTLTALARRAEETGDVGRKRDCLAAAREAAEALAATRRAGR